MFERLPLNNSLCDEADRPEVTKHEVTRLVGAASMPTACAQSAVHPRPKPPLAHECSQQVGSAHCALCNAFPSLRRSPFYKVAVRFTCNRCGVKQISATFNFLAD